MEKTAILGTVIRDTGGQFDDKHALQQFPSGLSLLGQRRSQRRKRTIPVIPASAPQDPSCTATSHLMVQKELGSTFLHT